MLLAADGWSNQAVAEHLHILGTIPRCGAGPLRFDACIDRRALAIQHANHAHGDVADADSLTNGIGGLKQFGDDSVPDDANLGGGDYVAVREKIAISKLPIPYGQIVRSHTVHFFGTPIGIAVNNLPAGAYQRRGRQHAGAFLGDGVGIAGT